MSEIKYDKKRLNPVKSILVDQPVPKDQNSPFHRLANQYDLKIDFVPFIKIDPVSIKDFRKQKINILNHTAIIFTSRNAVDHFFRIAEGMNVTVPTDMKYFCISEQTANYLQKYIVIRKRKIFIKDLILKASVGVYDNEKQNKQNIIVNLELLLSIESEPKTDHLKATQDYSQFRKSLIDIIQSQHFQLLEILVYRIHSTLMKNKYVLGAKVQVAKPDIFNDCEVAYELSNI